MNGAPEARVQWGQGPQLLRTSARSAPFTVPSRFTSAAGKDVPPLPQKPRMMATSEPLTSPSSLMSPWQQEEESLYERRRKVTATDHGQTEERACEKGADPTGVGVGAVQFDA